jgi:hypothetical protein
MAHRHWPEHLGLCLFKRLQQAGKFWLLRLRLATPLRAASAAQTRLRAATVERSLTANRFLSDCEAS